MVWKWNADLQSRAVHGLCDNSTNINLKDDAGEYEARRDDAWH